MIFITENDVLKKGLPIYHIERMITETGEPLGDEEHIIYVNSQIRDDTSLGRLMHDFACIEAGDMYYPVLADRVRYFKEDEKGAAVMCKAMEDMRNEAARENTLQPGEASSALTMRFVRVVAGINNRINHTQADVVDGEVMGTLSEEKLNQMNRQLKQLMGYTSVRTVDEFDSTVLWYHGRHL